MEIKCVIADDEKPARDDLVFFLSEHKDIKIVDATENAHSTISTIKKHCPDFVLLDIQMPDLNGFDVISEIKKMKYQPLIIFVTAYDQYAAKAYEKNVVDYILKPFSRERFNICITKVKNILQSKNQYLEQTAVVKKVPAYNKGRIVLLDICDIVFCCYRNRKIFVHIKTDIFPLYGIGTLDKLEMHLKRSSFFRSHRNYIINLDQIREFSPWFNGKYYVVMNDNRKTELTVSRGRVKTFRRHLSI